MFKKIVKAVQDLIFEPEVNEAQIETLLFFTTQTYIELFGHTLEEAKELAFQRVQKWIAEGKTEIALKRLWKTKYNIQ